MILWIAYEPAKAEASASDDIHTTIRGVVGARNAHRAMPNVWLVDTEESPGQWIDKFDDVLKHGDKMMITKLQRGTAAVNITDATDWAKVHRESY
jgi:hypothetical protein